MATEVKKVIDLIKSGVGAGLPENPEGWSIMQDPDGKEQLKLGFNQHREIITEVGYYAAPEVPIDIVASMAYLTEVMKEQTVMAASLIEKEDIEKGISDDGKVDKENEIACEVAVLMLKEALKRYSISYQERAKKMMAEAAEAEAKKKAEK